MAVWRLFDPIPGLALDDASDARPSDAEGFGDAVVSLSGGVPAANFPHRLGAQPRVGVVLAAGQIAGTDPARMPGTGREPSLRERVLHVVGSASEEEVIGPNATPVIAAMTDMQALRHRPVGDFPCGAVRGNLPPLAVDAAVAGAAQRPAPCPATAPLLDLLPEALCQRATIRRRDAAMATAIDASLAGLVGKDDAAFRARMLGAHLDLQRRGATPGDVPPSPRLRRAQFYPISAGG